MRLKKNGRPQIDQTSAGDAILRYLLTNDCTSTRATVRLSALGRIAFPECRFLRPQGAAFAVAKIVRSLQDRGLLSAAYGGGYFLTREGARYLAMSTLF